MFIFSSLFFLFHLFGFDVYYILIVESIISLFLINARPVFIKIDKEEDNLKDETKKEINEYYS
ncbi:MAG: hypothetical protein P9L98_04735 [Candidatus Kaelpia imicola]|nr:hypothetical protein [Candidatus Kaelpia imicola]